MLADSTILYVFENNLGKEHDHLTALLNRMDVFNNYYVLYENKTMVGFRTYARTKIAADTDLRTCISSNAVSFYQNLITINPDFPGSDQIKEKLIHQIEEMRQYVRRLPNGTINCIITSIYGIDNKRIKGNKDDLQRALSMLIRCANLFNQRELPVPYGEIESLYYKRRNVREGLGYIIRKNKAASLNKHRLTLRANRDIFVE